MASISNKKHLQEYVYDFAVDGGTKDVNIVLSDKDGKSPIPVGALITDVTARVITDIEGTSSTCSWGNDDDEDGYSGTTIAEATLVSGFYVNGHDLDAALLWDGTNDHKLYVNVADADDGDFIFLISTADLTAGKIWFGVEYLMPSVLS
jgi:hypothetical protein